MNNLLSVRAVASYLIIGIAAMLTLYVSVFEMPEIRRTSGKTFFLAAFSVATVIVAMVLYLYNLRKGDADKLLTISVLIMLFVPVFDGLSAINIATIYVMNLITNIMP